MKTIQIVAVVAGLSATASLAQTVSTPRSTNHTAGAAVSTVGAAAGVAPAAHEVPGGALATTVPAARPFAGGVTNGTRSISNGTSRTGYNVSTGGLTVNPNGSTSPKQIGIRAQGVNRAANQAGSAAAEAKTIPPRDKDLQCEPQDLAKGDC